MKYAMLRTGAQTIKPWLTKRKVRKMYRRFLLNFLIDEVFYVRSR